jgi:leucyl aminopeptidase (aminopeptidase T)
MVSTQSLAKSIVKGSLRPKEDEVVLISTYPHTIDLAEQAALECQKVGADPAIWLDTDALFYGNFKNYSEESLRRVSGHCVGLLDYVNSYIWLGGPRNPAPMAKVPQARFAAMFEGEKAHWDKAIAKMPKNVSVAIGQVTRERAKTYGFNYAKWKAIVEAAIVANSSSMESLGKLVAGLLSRPVDVRVRADNGTNLRFRLAGPDRKAAISDGVISDEDLALGTAASRSADLPAGDVYIAPVEESASGTFVADVPIPSRGKLVEGIAWTFKNGRVTDFAAKRNLPFAQTNWEEATGPKDMFGAIGFGLNPKAKPGFLQNSIVSGSVTVQIGDNRAFGGKNDSSYAFAGPLAHGTVEIGGKTVIEGGAWVI